MGSETFSESKEKKQKEVLMDDEEQLEASSSYYLAKFKLYETRSNFYMVGRDKSKRFWRVLKIDRSEPFDLVLCEDPTIYSFHECCSLLQRMHEGNRHIGGLKFVTTCYGIVGFIKFLGPYYMLLVTERRKIGVINGRAIYAVSKSRMIPIPHSTVRSNVENKYENRYKKLLSTVDITKDFFFSYSYGIMHSLQKNLFDNEARLYSYETMFVWNAFLTRSIRSHLGNSLWTVALVHGFFKQVKFSKSGRNFNLTLIARRSRHYAGTRYLKRGINEEGRAANDVETEQIVFEESPGGCASEISSVVQIRGSIPLYWSQETSRLYLRPDIILSKEDHTYEGTRQHFCNLFNRYGNPIIILNLIKTHEKKPRESILHAEFVNAIVTINRSLPKENRLKFQALDLNKLFRLKGTRVLTVLNKVAANTLGQTGFFYCQVPPFVNSNVSISQPYSGAQHDNEAKSIEEDEHVRPPKFQSGVLRTNCIDCLDRTNVAQYAYGLVALGRQLRALGITDDPEIDLDDPLAYKLMGVYEAMGDTLALQYGGSAAHNKIFSERKGHWRPATQSQEFIRTLQRYLNNAYMDPEKQDAINLFLGHFQPEVGKPALWELDSHQHYNIGRLTPSFSEDITRSILKRSLSDGNILFESCSPIIPADIRENYHCPLPDLKEGGNAGLSESSPEISNCETNISYTRLTPSISAKKLFADTGECSYFNKDEVEYIGSDILDLDGVSSSGNSCEEESYDRSSLVNSPSDGSLYGTELLVEERLQAEYSSTFVQWVEHGTMLVP